MLTIENIGKLRNKNLGKKNFYVASIENVCSIDNRTLIPYEHAYKFTLTNRKCAVSVILDREMESGAVGSFYKLHSSTGHKIYLHKADINNIDKFIDRLRLVALG